MIHSVVAVEHNISIFCGIRSQIYYDLLHMIQTKSKSSDCNDLKMQMSI